MPTLSLDHGRQAGAEGIIEQSDRSLSLFKGLSQDWSRLLSLGTVEWQQILVDLPSLSPPNVQPGENPAVSELHSLDSAPENVDHAPLPPADALAKTPHCPDFPQTTSTEQDETDICRKRMRRHG